MQGGPSTAQMVKSKSMTQIKHQSKAKPINKAHYYYQNPQGGHQPQGKIDAREYYADQYRREEELKPSPAKAVGRANPQSQFQNEKFYQAVQHSQPSIDFYHPLMQHKHSQSNLWTAVHPDNSADSLLVEGDRHQVGQPSGYDGEAHHFAGSRPYYQGSQFQNKYAGLQEAEHQPKQNRTPKKKRPQEVPAQKRQEASHKFYGQQQSPIQVQPFYGKEPHYGPIEGPSSSYQGGFKHQPYDGRPKRGDQYANSRSMEQSNHKQKYLKGQQYQTHQQHPTSGSLTTPKEAKHPTYNQALYNQDSQAKARNRYDSNTYLKQMMANKELSGSDSHPNRKLGADKVYPSSNLVTSRYKMEHPSHPTVAQSTKHSQPMAQQRVPVETGVFYEREVHRHEKLVKKAPEARGDGFGSKAQTIQHNFRLESKANQQPPSSHHHQHPHHQNPAEASRNLEAGVSRGLPTDRTKKGGDPSRNLLHPSDQVRPRAEFYEQDQYVSYTSRNMPQKWDTKPGQYDASNEPIPHQGHKRQSSFQQQKVTEGDDIPAKQSKKRKKPSHKEEKAALKSAEGGGTICTTGAPSIKKQRKPSTQHPTSGGGLTLSQKQQAAARLSGLQSHSHCTLPVGNEGPDGYRRPNLGAAKVHQFSSGRPTKKDESFKFANNLQIFDDSIQEERKTISQDLNDFSQNFYSRQQPPPEGYQRQKQRDEEERARLRPNILNPLPQTSHPQPPSLRNNLVGGSKGVGKATFNTNLAQSSSLPQMTSAKDVLGFDQALKFGGVISGGNDSQKLDTSTSHLPSYSQKSNSLKRHDSKYSRKVSDISNSAHTLHQPTSSFATGADARPAAAKGSTLELSESNSQNCIRNQSRDLKAYKASQQQHPNKAADQQEGPLISRNVSKDSIVPTMTPIFNDSEILYIQLQPEQQSHQVTGRARQGSWGDKEDVRLYSWLKEAPSSGDAIKRRIEKGELGVDLNIGKIPAEKSNAEKAATTADAAKSPSHQYISKALQQSIAENQNNLQKEKIAGQAYRSQERHHTFSNIDSVRALQGSLEAMHDFLSIYSLAEKEEGENDKQHPALQVLRQFQKLSEERLPQDLPAHIGRKEMKLLLVWEWYKEFGYVQRSSNSQFGDTLKNHLSPRTLPKYTEESNRSQPAEHRQGSPPWAMMKQANLAEKLAAEKQEQERLNEINYHNFIDSKFTPKKEEDIKQPAKESAAGSKYDLPLLTTDGDRKQLPKPTAVDKQILDSISSIEREKYQRQIEALVNQINHLSQQIKEQAVVQPSISSKATPFKMMNASSTLKELTQNISKKQDQEGLSITFTPPDDDEPVRDIGHAQLLIDGSQPNLLPDINLATVTEENEREICSRSRSSNLTHSQQNNSKIIAAGKSQGSATPVPITPLPLDQIMNHVCSFGANLESLESKLNENKRKFENLKGQQNQQAALSYRMSQHTSSQGFPHQPSVSGNYGHGPGSVLQGVQGGIDTQSLETILEFKDLDLQNCTETVTSRLDVRDIRAYNNSSTLSNFMFPQNTNRTNRTNISLRSGNGRNQFGLNGLIGLNGGGNGQHLSKINCNKTMNNFQRNSNILVGERAGDTTERNVVSGLALSSQRQQHNLSQQNVHSEAGRMNEKDLKQLAKSGGDRIKDKDSSPEVEPASSPEELKKEELVSGTEPVAEDGAESGPTMSLIFEELQQNKKQMNQIMEWLMTMKGKMEEPHPVAGGTTV